uniref:Uncharacterized protein n=1 Tax=Oryza punctata TaxID=4537 RepID=A0A0E0KZV2_ORYPU
MATEEEDLTNGDFPDDADVKSSPSSSLFDLDLTVFGDQWVASGRREEEEEEEEVDFAGADGGEAVNVASAEEDGRGGVGDGSGSVVAALGPAARLRGLLLRKLRKSKAGGGNPAGGGGTVSPEGQSGRFLVKVRANSMPRLEERAIAGGEEERRAATKPKEAARKYLNKITTSLARRRGGPDPAMVAAPTGKTPLRRSSMAAAAGRGIDGSAQHLQDGIESAIAHCKLSLRTATTAPS